MSTINVTRSLVSRTNPTETQFDTMRTYLLNFFNSASLDGNNIADGGMVYTTLSDLGDDETLSFEDDVALLIYDNSNDIFAIEAEEDMFFGGLYLRGVDGFIEVNTLNTNTGVGSTAVNLQWLLSRYRKPRLTYVSDDIVSTEANGPDGNTYIMGRDRLWKLVDTTCSLGVNANGETTGDTGAAVSGLGAGLTRTANRWYFVYAVEVQFGDDADGINCILVTNVTPPISSNITTLNTAFGAGKWLYMGIVRNGYNDGVSTNVIVPFKYEEDGYMRFTQSPNSEGIGLTLGSATSNINQEYTVDFGNDVANTIPEVATRVTFSGHRETHGLEFHYRNIATDENHMITTSCYHISGLSTLVSTLWFEVPILDGYKLVDVIGNVETDQRFCMVGMMDHYV